MVFPHPHSSSSPWELAPLGFGFQEEKKVNVNAANAGFSSSGHRHHPASAALPLPSSLSSYNDHSNEQNLLPDGLSDKFLLHFKCGRSGTELPFPVKLHSMLDFVHDQGLSHIVSWQCHGRSFTVHKQKEFVDVIMKHYFKQTKFPSFQRQLNLYGFKRLTSGKDKGSYYHEFFLRQKRFLSYQINRVKIKGTKVRQASTPNSEPDFYSMTFLPAVAHHDDTATTTATGGAARTTQEEAPAAPPQAPTSNTMFASPPPPNPLPPTSTPTGGEDVQETLKEPSSSPSRKAVVMDPSPTPKKMLPTTGFVAPMPPHLPPPVLPSAAETPPQHMMMKKSVIDPSSPSKDRSNTMLGPNGLLAPTTTGSSEHAPGGGDGRRLTATSTTTLPSPTRRVNHNFARHQQGVQQGGGDVHMGGSLADPAVTGRPTPPPARRNSSSLRMMRPLPPPPLPLPVMESSFLQTKILAGSIQQIFSPCSTSTSKDTTTSTQNYRQQEVPFDSVGSQQVLKRKVLPPIAEAPRPSPPPCGQQHDVGPLMKMKYSPVMMKTSSSSSSEEPSSSSSEEPSSASSYNTSSSCSSSSWWVPPPPPFQQQDQQHQAAAAAGALLPPPPRNLYATEDFDAFDDEILDSLMKASQASSSTLSLSPVPTTTTAAASRTTNTAANIKTRPSAAVGNEYDQQKPGAVAPGHQLVSFTVDPTWYYHHHHVI